MKIPKRQHYKQKYDASCINKRGASRRAKTAGNKPIRQWAKKVIKQELEQ